MKSIFSFLVFDVSFEGKLRLKSDRELFGTYGVHFTTVQVQLLMSILHFCPRIVIIKCET
jgi:membrane-anchored protein YejM (alkaline phosphatase superfamily)